MEFRCNVPSTVQLNEVLQLCSIYASSANDHMPKGVTGFETYMTRVREDSELNKVHSVRIRKGHIGQKNYGVLVQEKFKFKDLEH